MRVAIEKIGICNSLKQFFPVDYLKFMDLFKKHPEYPAKLEGANDIAITLNKWRQLQLNLVKGSTLEPISWASCMKKVPIKGVKSKMRELIAGQIIEFRRTSSDICEICGVDDAEKYHVDHIIRFCELANAFLQDHDISSWNGEEKWKKYHFENCSLRILCKSCNLMRG
jgi:hypothetical protein